MDEESTAGKGLTRLRRKVAQIKRNRWLGAAGGALLMASGTPWLANAIIDRYCFRRLYAEVADVPSRQVAIVLGARVSPDGAPSAVLADRLAAALDLYRAERAEKILVSGDHQAPEYDETNAMARWLSERGVPAEDLFTDHAGLRTLDTMERAARVFQVTNAVVCTQDFHLRRSVFLARRAGIDAVGFVADRRRYAHARANESREALAKVVAVLDSFVWRRGPKHLGHPIPISGDARASHDR
jgi:SanA protein